MNNDMSSQATGAAEGPGAGGEMIESSDQYTRICQFLFDEADLLDRRRYVDWFALLTADIHYRVRGGATATTTAVPYQFVIFDDRASDLNLRVHQLSDPNLTHAENPAPMTRRFISNVRVARGAQAGEFHVSSYVLLYRNGGTINEPFIYSGLRRDVLRTEGGAFRIARRDVDLDCAVVSSPNISSFF